MIGKPSFSEWVLKPNRYSKATFEEIRFDSYPCGGAEGQPVLTTKLSKDYIYS